ncbi:MAG: YceH family protein [Terriglobales bacterium]
MLVSLNVENSEEKRAATIVLTAIEARVLGSLIEKDITTPDYYPLSLNALVNACNQKNNRDPVMALDEASVRTALDSLQQKRLAGPTSGADSRVTKYEHRFQEVFNFTRGETALMCVLLLRGAQTPGGLRGRTERLHHFEDLTDVQSTLQRLMQCDPPLATMLDRQPGTKESRYMHLLSGDVEDAIVAGEAIVSKTAEEEENRIAKLEEELANLKAVMDDIKQELASFRKQFE